MGVTPHSETETREQNVRVGTGLVGREDIVRKNDFAPRTNLRAGEQLVPMQQQKNKKQIERQK